MTARTFVDTNVWVYAVDDGAPEKQARAREVVGPTPDKDIVVSAQVLGEFYVTVRRKLAATLPASDAVALVDRMRRLPVVPIDGDLVATAITNAEAWQSSYWDALIIAAAETSGCSVVLTEDLADGRTYGSVLVENPFRTISAPPLSEGPASDA